MIFFKLKKITFRFVFNSTFLLLGEQIKESNVQHKNKVRDTHTSDWNTVTPGPGPAGMVTVVCVCVWFWQLTPYLGATLQGVVRATVVRGRLVFRDGLFSPEPLGKLLLVAPQRNQAQL